MRRPLPCSRFCREYRRHNLRLGCYDYHSRLSCNPNCHNSDNLCFFFRWLRFRLDPGFDPCSRTATTAYLKSLMNALVPVQGCPIGFICKPKTTTKNQETITKQTLVNNPQAPVITSATFTRSIQVGATGKDVKILQKYLNSQGYTIATTGPGSLGHETDLFGNLTKQALKTFQKAHGLPATGFFGPLTQKVVNSNDEVMHYSGNFI